MCPRRTLSAKVLDLDAHPPLRLALACRLLAEVGFQSNHLQFKRSDSHALQFKALRFNFVFVRRPRLWRRLRHVIAYSDPKAERRETSGVLEDYAFTVIACLDAYEATAGLELPFASRGKYADAMVAGFYDQEKRRLLRYAN